MLSVKSGLKFKLSTFSLTGNAHKTPREKKSNDFLKGRSDYTQFLVIFSRKQGETH